MVRRQEETMAYSMQAGACPVVPVTALFDGSGGKALSFSVHSVGLTFYMLRDCLCFGQERGQAITPVSPGGSIPCIFQESCPYPVHEPLLAGIVKANLCASEVEVEEAVPLYPFGSTNLWHWTLESLPKLLALESTGYNGPYIIPAQSLADPASVVRQSLAMFDIAESRLLPSGPLYRVKRLILPQRLSGFGLKDNMPLCEFLRGRLLEAVGSLEGAKRLYVRRIGRRRVMNEGDVLEVLSEFGFTVMTPEEHSQKEQWRLMTNVECSVMPHGANSTLTLLQKPRSGAVEFYSNRYVSYSNLHSARLLKLRYVPFVEELDQTDYTHVSESVSSFLSQGLQTDIAVDPKILRILLESLL